MINKWENEFLFIAIVKEKEDDIIHEILGMKPCKFDTLAA